MKRRSYTAIAAFCLLMQGCLGSPEDQFTPLPYNGPLPHITAKVSNFSNCEDLQAWYRGQTNTWEQTNLGYYNSYVGVSPAIGTTAPSMGAPAAGVPDSPVTNVQVPGIDEPDLVKTFNGRIYYARSHSVEVLSSQDLSPVTTLNFDDLSNLQLLQFANRLAVIGMNSGVEIRIFKDSGGQLSEEKTFSFPGTLLTARQQASDLILVVRGGLANRPPQIPCAQIAKPVLENSFDFGLTSVHTLNLAAEEVTSDSMAAVGGADQVYMSEKNLYLFKTGYSWFAWDPRAASDPLYNSSIVSKLELRKGHAPKLLAATAVSGQTRNNLAFSEDKTGRYLFIATTIGWPYTNRIWVIGDNPNPKFDESPLKIVATSQEFGANEDIRAVRFIGDNAYVVTYQKTDPLFVFDLSQPENPRLKSELEMPGFSAYLHSLGTQQLFGAGYAGVQEQGFAWLAGVQLSLFNLKSDGTVSIQAQKQFGGRGSHIDAAHDYHAFALDARTGIIALPVKIMTLEPKADPWAYSTEVEFTGAFMVDPKSGLDPVGRLTHSEWIPSSCHDQLTMPTWWNDNRDSFDIRRVVAVDNGLVSLSPFGAKLHDAQAPFTTRASRSFANPEPECQPMAILY